MKRPPFADRLRGIKVTEQLAKQMQRANPEQFAQIIRLIEFYLAQLRRADREQRPSPGGRAAGVHDALTRPLAVAWAHPPAGHTVQCQRGCASCCRMLVTVFPDEATLALLAAEDVGVKVDRAHLERQAEAGDSVVAWRRLSREDRTCVFLRDEQCSIYEHRPSACRKYAVASPPEMCDHDRHPGHEVAMIVCAEAEVVTSVAITVWGKAAFAPALLTALAEDDKSRAGDLDDSV